MRKTEKRPSWGIVLLAVALLIAWGSCAPDKAVAEWTHSPVGGYETYYWDGAEKFRYSSTAMQWQHYSSFGGWYDLTSMGFSSAFIGDGNWYNMHNGLYYRYNVANDYGFFTRGGQYRFYYRYALGQWYTSGFGGGWYTLGAASMSGSVLSDGYSHDLGNGMQFRYNAQVDYGYYTRNSQYRFYYRYAPGQWYATGCAGGWYTLGNSGRSASVVPDGAYHNVVSGLWFKYLAATDESYTSIDGADTGDRFHYAFDSGQWSHRGGTGGWYDLGLSGNCAPFIADGNSYDLGNGFMYSYSPLHGQAYWKSGGTTRFAYSYGPGNWFHYDSNNASWRLASGRSADFVATSDPAGTDLGNGFFYRFAGNVGYWLATGADRFSYDYATGQWSHYGLGSIPVPLSYAGASGQFLGDGGPVSVSGGFVYWYDKLTGVGHWVKAGMDRFAYDYANTQWSDFIAGRGWKALGAIGQSVDFIGDGLSHDLGEGYQYTFTGGLGYFLFDPTHHYRQSYDTGQWEFQHTDANWYAWGGSGLLQGQWPTSSGTNPPEYILYNGFIYFITNDGGGLELYQWDGASFAEVSGNRNFTNFAYLNTVGPDLYFSGRGGTTGNGYDLFRYDGTTFAEVSGNINFSIFNYFTTVGNAMFFSGTGGTHGTGYDVYRWTGAVFEELSARTRFTTLTYFTTAGGAVFFGGTGGSSGTGYDLFSWDGATFGDRSGNIGFSTLVYFATIGTEVFVRGNAGTSGTGYDLFGWNGTAFQDRSGNIGFTTLNYVTTVGTNLFVSGTGGTSGSGYDLFRWDATGLVFQELSGNIGFSSTLTLLATSATDLFVSGTGGTSGTGYDLFRWNATDGFGELSGNKGFSTLNYLASDGTRWFFAGTGGTTGTGYDLFGWDAVNGFVGLSGDVNFTGLTYLTALDGNLFFNGIGGASGTGYDLFRWNSTDGFLDASGDTGFAALNLVYTTASDLYFTAIGGTSGTGYDLFRWNATGGFEDLSGNIDFDALNYVTTTASGSYFTGWDGTGGQGFDLYRWNGTAFEELTGNKNFFDMQLFTTFGTDLYFEVKDTSYDIYRWNGTAFTRVADINALALSNVAPVYYNDHLFFYAQTGTPWFPGRLWITNYDFLVDRM